ncbi:hypothetical protein Pan54_10220 [Rubinisphaera italica]|uniref:Uncharacterized protein n=1 Tax=Rubinisphaera italica TaxID=2527969 RepID=A0A5C5XC03_9PLAN|nr:hypothetical protein Pan54_10220 [Rubinisphaera italica]
MTTTTVTIRSNPPILISTTIGNQVCKKTNLISNFHNLLKSKISNCNILHNCKILRTKTARVSSLTRPNR